MIKPAVTIFKNSSENASTAANGSLSKLHNWRHNESRKSCASAFITIVLNGRGRGLIPRSRFIAVRHPGNTRSASILTQIIADARRGHYVISDVTAIITVRRRRNLKRNTASDVAEKICASSRALCALHSS
ncbi:hypothetical protein ACS0PU_011619 [Formica fusca]